MKERQFVSVAKLSGVGDFGIIFTEILPDLLPFIAAAFVNQVFGAVFASLYLAVLGLGPLPRAIDGQPYLGSTSTECILQWLVVVALCPCRCAGSDSGLARPHQHGVGRSCKSSHSPNGVVS